MKRTILIAAAALSLVTLTACNTVKGLGQDLQAAGDAVAQASDDVRSHLLDDRPTATASAGETCDPGGKELAGRSNLPPCR
ncbi:entericidin A/B family lipoprotein [Hyphomonas sp.]|uniref:entericidin A/B family lipoprotein n=1 Tax=Hyphomonas sp. TaxID=87 RepID=UPI00391CEC33